MTVSVDAILSDADCVRQMRNTAMVISVGNDNMLGNIIDADGVRQMRNTAVTILMLAMM